MSPQEPSCPVLLACVTLFQFLSSKVVIIGSIKESVEDQVKVSRHVQRRAAPWELS